MNSLLSTLHGNCTFSFSSSLATATVDCPDFVYFQLFFTFFLVFFPLIKHLFFSFQFYAERVIVLHMTLWKRVCEFMMIFNCSILQAAETQQQLDQTRSQQQNKIRLKFRFLMAIGHSTTQNRIVRNGETYVYIHKYNGNVRISSYSCFYVMIIIDCDAYTNHHNDLLKFLWSNALT